MNIDKLRTAKWSYDIDQDVLRWSRELSQIFDLGEEADSMSIENYRGCIHAKDRRRFFESFEEAIRLGGHLDLDYRILRNVLATIGDVDRGFRARAENWVDGADGSEEAESVLMRCLRDECKAPTREVMTSLGVSSIVNFASANLLPWHPVDNP